MTPIYPLRLAPSFKKKLWGSLDLRPVFGHQDEAIGEVWYTSEKNLVENGEFSGRTLGSLLEHLGRRLMGSRYKPSALRRRSAGEIDRPHSDEPQFYFPILTKLLFPSDRLSVQVHPDDVYALRREGGPGKTEMWYVVDAAPNAEVAAGLKQPLPEGELRSAIRDGSIESLLNWVKIKRGQTVFVPAGTIHAIGGGSILCEIQQNSDLTYRLFDYGRLDADGKPRQLDIEKALAVARPESRPAPRLPLLVETSPCRRELLAACRYFAVELLKFDQPFDYPPDPERAHILVFLRGAGEIVDAQNDAHRYEPGASYLIPAEAGMMRLNPASSTECIRAYTPDLAQLEQDLRARGIDAGGHVDGQDS